MSSTASSGMTKAQKWILGIIAVIVGAALVYFGVTEYRKKHPKKKQETKQDAGTASRDMGAPVPSAPTKVTTPATTATPSVETSAATDVTNMALSRTFGKN